MRLCIIDEWALKAALKSLWHTSSGPGRTLRALLGLKQFPGDPRNEPTALLVPRPRLPETAAAVCGMWI